MGYAIIKGRYWCTRVLNGTYITTKVVAGEVRDGGDGKEGELRVREILKSRITAAMNGHERPALIVAPPAPTADGGFVGPVGTIAELAEEYEDMALEHIDGKLTPRGAKKKEVLQAARRYYFGREEKESPALAVKAIRQRIIEVNKSSRLASGTRQGYMIQLSAMFDYAVQAGHLDTNPLAALKKPANDAEQIERFTAEEVAALLNYTTRREVWLAVKLQSLIGARAEEMLSIPRDRVTLDDPSSAEFWIRGKGNKWRRFTLVILPELKKARAGVKVLRREWLESIREIMAELMAGPAPRSGRLFHLQYEQYRKFFVAAKEAGVIPRDNRGSHSLRKFAIHYWRTELRLTPEIRQSLAAHSEKVSEKHYLSELTATEQARAILLDTA